MTTHVQVWLENDRVKTMTSFQFPSEAAAKIWWNKATDEPLVSTTGETIEIRCTECSEGRTADPHHGPTIQRDEQGNCASCNGTLVQAFAPHLKPEESARVRALLITPSSAIDEDGLPEPAITKILHMANGMTPDEINRWWMS